MLIFKLNFSSNNIIHLFCNKSHFLVDKSLVILYPKNYNLKSYPMKRLISALLLTNSLIFSSFAFASNPSIREVTWDKDGLIMAGKRVTPVMGEIHYSRIPADEWRNEIKKMKDGGITLIANYVFWNHHENKQGVYDWSGNKELRRFLYI